MKRSKGFTLVELLIVIIIIGILAGMMMLSTGAATDKAEATKIVADLRNIKSASLMYYADEGVWPSADIDLHTNDTEAKKVNKYLDSIPTDGYKIGFKTGTVSAGYDNATKLTSGVQSKLAVMKDVVGLYNDAPTSADITTGPNYTTGTKVYIVIKK